MKPERIIADRAHDSRPLWERLRQRGIDLIVPHRRRRRDRFQDGRQLRRYRRRWLIERTNAWLLNFRRLTVRYDHNLDHYRAFVYLACALITLRQF
jgi:transposase